MASTPGMIISMIDTFVEMAAHAAKSDSRSGLSSNCRRTSSIISEAARPTAVISSAAMM